MRIVTIFLMLIFGIIGLSFAQGINDDSITITTYYPSPYGSFAALQLYPQDTQPDSQDVPCNGKSTAGTMYYNYIDKQVYVCDGTAWKGISNYWSKTALDSQSIYNVNTKNVGIGTSDAVLGSRLVIKGAGATATTSSLNVIDSSGVSLFTVIDNGNVGIGNSAPSAKLQVSGSAIVDGSTTINGKAAVNGTPAENGNASVNSSVTYKPRVNDYTLWPAGSLGELAYSSLSGKKFFYYYDGFSWKQVGSNQGSTYTEYTAICSSWCARECDAACAPGESLKDCQISGVTGGSAATATVLGRWKQGNFYLACYTPGATGGCGYAGVKATCMHW